MAQAMDERCLSPNNRTLSLYGVRPMCEKGDLCSECESVFNKLIWPQQHSSNNKDEEPFRPIVGWLDRMIATKSCTLCQFLADIFDRTSGQFPQQEILTGRRFLCQIGSNARVSTETGITLDWNMDIRFWDLLHEDSRPILPWKQSYIPHIRLLARSAHLLVGIPNGFQGGERIHSLARPMQEQCSVSFIRETYRLCSREHGDLCEVRQNVFSTPVRRVTQQTDRKYPSKLIDVDEYRVIDAPRESRYVALSYCWARQPYTTLLRSNHESLHRKNGLDPQHLAPTIADAIKVVVMMGERYLWVDALCIVQDDGAMKMKEIGQMSTIYRDAIVTIVAANADTDGTDPGLPGIREDSRPIQQQITNIRGLEFATTMPDLTDSIQASRWYTRYWTYQEHHLSRRELIFTPFQTFFVCQKDGFSEDFIDHACVHPESGEEQRPCCEYETPTTFDDRINTPDQGIGIYEALAHKISDRSLSHEFDALNAITGILSVMKYESGISFWCGLPIPNMLGRFVFWLPRQGIRRRVQGDFPSWSWIGWVGPVIYPCIGEFFDGKMNYRHDELVSAQMIQVLVPSAISVDCVIGSQSYTRTTLIDAEQGEASGSLLQLTVDAATMLISQFAWGTFSDCDGYSSRCHAIVVQGSCAGLMIFAREGPLHIDTDLTGRSHSEAWRISVGKCGSYELIALSRTDVQWPLYFPIVTDPNSNANFSHLDEDGDIERDHLPFDVTVWDEDGFELVNVMVIEWRGDIAYRLGVGQMHSVAWESVHPQEKLVVLG